MDAKSFFENFHKNNSQSSLYSLSLKDFFQHIVAQRMLSSHQSVLDMGCGSCSLFEDLIEKNLNVTAIDFSAQAIMKAPKSLITYKNISLDDTFYFSKNSYDLIFDSHCLHCLLSSNERETALNNIFISLNQSGLFASEMMVQPVGRVVSFPFKNIKTTLEIEAELLEHGFKIIYFAIASNQEFYSESLGEVQRCDVLRVIATK